jgi:MoxR-like ATPase
MKASNLKVVLTESLKAGLRILIVGQPGMGKSALTNEVKADLNYPLYTLYSSISDPTDFKGIPCIVNGEGRILPFEELALILNATSPVIVFLDDFGQGAPAVQAAQMSFLDKCLLNSNIRIVAATNRREDRAGVSGLLEPVKSRFDSIINMEFDMDDDKKLDRLCKVVEERLCNLDPVEVRNNTEERKEAAESAKGILDVIGSYL